MSLRSFAGVCCVLALAATASFSSLAAEGDRSAADSAKAVAKVQQAPAPKEDFNHRDPREWVDLGKNAALAITEVAGGLGVAADKVLDSTSGKIAVALIGAKVLGVKAEHIAEIPYRIAAFFIGILLFGIGMVVWGRYLKSVTTTPVDTSGDADTATTALVQRGVVTSAIIPILLISLGMAFYAGVLIALGIIAALGLSAGYFIYLGSR